ncbi:hypothetical protein [Nocardia huaxiensis]|uniref:Uncharacterized protein n=1 Tax=Nocardia huaxiensis TaxID=2755382 RepID=A0A7D6VE45_9NOCA|nr:hypothetical protein [Nocardia huaxiensis]QLY30315.1 hypothetical protein H0264_35160 [Nocardia huaxiensis]UFS96051.1 hypothetical protein LPY97_36285 [Nocardia huaxiensis]
MQDTPTHPHTGRRAAIWPALAALILAAATAYDLTSGVDLAQIIAASAIVYLGSAALGNQNTAWPVFLVTFVVIGAAKAIGFDGTWILLALAVPLAIYGLTRRRDIGLQGAAMLAFGAVAVIALLIDETVGAYLVAAGLLGHTAWDIHHFRTDRVVARSMSEFCMVLDTVLAVAIIVVEIS